MKDSIPYLEQKSIPVPKSWKDGGGLQRYAKEFGITPDEDNGITGRGHHARYGSKKMYEFCKKLVKRKKGKGKHSRQELPQKSTKKSKKVFDSQISIADIMPIPKQDDELKISFELFKEQLDKYVDKYVDKHIERKLTELLEKQQNKDERTESR